MDSLRGSGERCCPRHIATRIVRANKPYIGREDAMALKRCAFVFVLILLANGLPAGAKEERGSSWDLETALTFEQTFEPFARVDRPQACAAICLKDERCTGWTYYRVDFSGAGRETWESLRGACVVGAGVKDRKIGNAPGRISGVIGPRFVLRDPRRGSPFLHVLKTEGGGDFHNLLLLLRRKHCLEHGRRDAGHGLAE